MSRFGAILVDLAKLRDYCLSETHPRGRNKARIFKKVFGFTGDDAELLQEALISAVRGKEADLEETSHDQYGQRFQLDFAFSTAW